MVSPLMRALCSRIVEPLSADAYLALNRFRALFASSSVFGAASWTAHRDEVAGVGSTAYWVVDARAPSSSPMARHRGLRGLAAGDAA